jgi:hypothetical protein
LYLLTVLVRLLTCLRIIVVRRSMRSVDICPSDARVLAATADASCPLLGP